MMPECMSLRVKKMAAWNLALLLFFSPWSPVAGWCSDENRSIRPAGFTQAHSDEKIFQAFHRVQRMWRQGLIFFLELRGYHETRKNIWVRREPYATYRFDMNAGEWTIVYEVNPKKPRAGWDSVLMRLWGTQEHDFTGQANRLYVRFGGSGRSQGTA